MNKLMYSGEEVNQILFEITLEKAKAEEKLKKIEQIVENELSPLSLDEMSNAEIQIRKVLEQEYDYGK